MVWPRADVRTISLVMRMHSCQGATSYRVNSTATPRTNHHKAEPRSSSNIHTYNFNRNRVKQVCKDVLEIFQCTALYIDTDHFTTVTFITACPGMLWATVARSHQATPTEIYTETVTDPRTGNETEAQSRARSADRFSVRSNDITPQKHIYCPIPPRPTRAALPAKPKCSLTLS